MKVPSRFAAYRSLPIGYSLTRRITLESVRALILLNLASLIPLVIGGAFFYGADRVLQTLNVSPVFNFSLDAPLLFILVLVIFLLIMLSFHELCHGVAFQVFGARPKYGINLSKGVAFASAGNYYVMRDAYLIVALAPLITIALICVLLMALTGDGLRAVVALLGTLNTASSVGDLWFVLICLRYPRDLLVRDFGDGAELFVAGSAGEQILAS